MSQHLAAGWFGKLPTLGDFVRRRLPDKFVDAWDDWLARELGAWREAEGEAWLQAYLSAPTWRFVTGADVPYPGSPGWHGVLMPSVDRVGRYFPLTLAAPKPVRQDPGLPSPQWLATLEQHALAAMHDDWSAEQLEQTLSALGLPGPEGDEEVPRGGVLWTRWGGDGNDPPALLTRGLPSGWHFSRLLQPGD